MLPLENAFTTNFLMTCGRIFSEEQLISIRMLDALRIAINPHASQLKDETETANLWQVFFDRKDELSAFFVSWFGKDSLSSLYTNYLIEKSLQDLVQVFAVLGDLLTEKSKLFFNRSLISGGRHGRGAYERHLFPSLTNEYGQLVASALTSLAAEESSCSFLYVRHSSLANFHKINQRISFELGLKGVKPSDSFYYDYLKLKQKIISSLSQIIDGGIYFLESCAFHGSKSQLWQISSLLQGLKNDLYKFSLSSQNELSFSFEWGSSLKDQMSILRYFAQSILHLKEQFSAFFSSMDFDQRTFDLMQNQEDDFKIQMLKSGASFKDTEEALRKLKHYCLFHETDPSQLLSAELEKLHPLFKQLDWQILSASFKMDPLSLNHLEMKESNLERMNDLKVHFQKFLVHGTVLVLLCLFVFPACGVKTSPKSPLQEERVQIPFR